MSTTDLICGLIALSGVLWAVGLAEARAEDAQTRDLATLRQRFLKGASGNRFIGHTSRAKGLLRSLTEEGRWDDIAYDGQGVHLERVTCLAYVWRHGTDGIQPGDETVAEAIRRSLAYWLELDPQNPNWYFNEIRNPGHLGAMGLLAWPALTEELRTKVLTVMELRSPIIANKRGANLLWIANINLTRGLLAEDPELVGRVLSRIWEEIRFADYEGIQPDFSFWQHGEMLYSGGYGRVFGMQMANLIAMTSDLVWRVPDDKVDLFSSFVLDGQQWMTYGRMFDFNARGREIARKEFDIRRSSLGLCENILKLDPPRKAEFEAFAARANGLEGAPALVGNRQFWRTDFMVHRRAGWYSSVKLTSRRIIGTESGNGEGLLDYFLLFGVHTTALTDRDYFEIYPLWDWDYLPGITTWMPEDQAPLLHWQRGANGTTDFVGGVSDGQVGLSTIDFDRDKVRYRRTWAMLDDCVWVLTADLQCDSELPVHTSLEQKWALGPATVWTASADEPVAVDEARQEWSDVTRIWHGEVAYLLGRPMPARVVVETRKRSWRRITEDDQGRVAQGRVFCASLDHGVSPDGDTFHYVVVPRVKADQPLGDLGAVLRNTRAIQAVRSPKGAVFAAFYEAGSLDIPEVGMLTVDQPCLVLLQSTETGWTAHVADPTQTLASLTLALANAGPAFRATVVLPTGDLAGQSQEVQLMPAN